MAFDFFLILYLFTFYINKLTKQIIITLNLDFTNIFVFFSTIVQQELHQQLYDLQKQSFDTYLLL